ncbi:MAG: response regulator [Capsulimonadaceae bacterium]
MNASVEEGAPDVIRVMLVDDHAVVRLGLKMVLNSEPDIRVVAEASSCEGAVAEFGAHRPDVSLLDLRLNGESGLDAVVEIRARYPGAKIIILSTYERDEDIYRTIRAGVMGYVVKDTPAAEIVSAIRSVNNNRRYVPPRVSEKLAGRLSMPDLSDREIAVLRLMTAGQSNKEIASSLGLSLGTVKCHVNSLLAKLDVEDRTQAVVTALRKGVIELDASNVR